jgi:hypothetical protein
MQEVYRSLAERREWTHAVLAALAIGTSSYTIVLAAQAIVKATRLVDLDLTTPAERFFYGSLPVIFSLAVPFTLASALFRTAKTAFVVAFSASSVANDSILADVVRISHDSAKIATRLRVTAVVCVISSIIITTFFRRHGRRYHAQGVTFFSRHWLSVSLLSAFAIILFSMIFATSDRAAVAIGTIPVVSLFTILFCLALSAVRIGFYKSGFSPVVTALLFALLFSLLGLNNNHLEVMTPLSQGKNLFDAAGPQLAFEQWYASRKDMDSFTNAKKPYPVFIIAAQGGGIYAAGQAALFLTRMQDRCPVFSQHIFAISSVSGGSIGSSFFASIPPDLIKNQSWEPCKFGEMPTGRLEERARAFTQSDLLSPVVASAIFPDLLQRFIPFPMRFTDRGKALDAALERAWSDSQHLAPNPFQQRFLDTWQPNSASPALMINSTDVNNGRRVLISPFAVDPVRASSDSQQSWFYETAEMKRALTEHSLKVPSVKEDLRLSQAVGISARFPWILPAAVVERGDENLQLVDGGYFDNSGIETTLDLIEDLIAIRQTYQANSFEIHLVTFTGFQYDTPAGWRGFDDVLAPVRALLSSRESRGALSYTKAATTPFFVCAGIPNCPPPPYDILPAATLDQQDLSLALGFELSDNSLNLIQAEVGDPSKCTAWSERDGDSQAAKRLTEHAYGNSCVACTVQYWLHGEQVPANVQYPCGSGSQPASLGKVPNHAGICLKKGKIQQGIFVEATTMVESEEERKMITTASSGSHHKMRQICPG